MTDLQFFEALMSAKTGREADQYCLEYSTRALPVGGKLNNTGVVDLSLSAEKALVERVTNSIDAQLDAAVSRSGKSFSTPREAAAACFPDRLLAAKGVMVSLLPSGELNTTGRFIGSYKKDVGIIEIRDYGVGIAPEAMSDTILNTNGSNKLDKFYLMGQFGQGGSSTYPWCNATVIASRAPGRPVCFTVVRFNHLDPSKYKTGTYEYLVNMDGELPTVDVPEDVFPVGTHIRHLDFRFPGNFTSIAGDHTCYVTLQAALFEPPIPVTYRNGFVTNVKSETIWGSAHKLNTASAAKVCHKDQGVFDLGQDGTLTVRLWALPEARDDGKWFSGNYVESSHPLLITHNGQTHKELPLSHIARAGLTYLTHQVIVQIVADGLSPEAKRNLLTPTRQDIKKGEIFEVIIGQVEGFLAQSTELRRLNEEAKDRLHQTSEDVSETMRKELAAILKMDGSPIGRQPGSHTSGQEYGTKRQRRRAVRTVKGDGDNTNALPPVELRDPPTYVEFAFDHDLKLHPGQKMWLTVETDALDKYNDSLDVFCPEDLHLVSRKPLRDGSFKIQVEALPATPIDRIGTIIVELRPPKLRTLTATKTFKIVEPEKKGGKPLTMPDVTFNFVKQSNDYVWYTQLEWPTDITAVAFEWRSEENGKAVFANEHFPPYRKTFDRLSSKDPALADQFKTRYRLYVTALCLKADQVQTDLKNPEVPVEYTRQMNVAHAELYAYIAAREVEHEREQVTTAAQAAA